jgi:hypothetical protein
MISYRGTQECLNYGYSKEMCKIYDNYFRGIKSALERGESPEEVESEARHFYEQNRRIKRVQHRHQLNEAEMKLRRSGK